MTQVAVPFKDKRIHFLLVDGEECITVRSICEALNVSYEKEIEKITPGSFLALVTKKISASLLEGEQEPVYVIPLKFALGYPLSIEKEWEKDEEQEYFRLMKMDLTCFFHEVAEKGIDMGWVNVPRKPPTIVKLYLVRVNQEVMHFAASDAKSLFYYLANYALETFGEFGLDLMLLNGMVIDEIDPKSVVGRKVYEQEFFDEDEGTKTSLQEIIRRISEGIEEPGMLFSTDY